MPSDMVVFVADAGSVARKNFHWVCSQSREQPCNSADELASQIVEYLKQGRKVALGYECPLFVPCPEESTLLGKARKGECTKETGNRAFSAASGACVLATGVQSLAWVLDSIKKQRGGTRATTSWPEFREGGAELLVWEAFVSGSEKAGSHVGDAQLAMEAFEFIQTEPIPKSALSDQAPFSLVGAAILHAGLSEDLGLLRTPCLVLRPRMNQASAA